METLAIIAALSSITNIMVTLIGGLIFIMKMNSRLDVQNVQIGALLVSTENIGKILTATAVVEQKIAAHTDMIATINRQVEDLRRGVGLIEPRREHV